MEDEELCLHFTQTDIKPTANRLLIARALEKSEQAMSITDLETALETIDKSTIFRTITLFRDHHLVHEIDDGSGSLKYALSNNAADPNPKHQHVHFWCEKCQRTFCLQNMEVPMVNLPKGFTVNAINYVMKGICPKCARLNNKK